MIIQVDNPVLEIHDLTVSYNKKPVLWGIDFNIPAGTLTGILGPNGSGKSTLLKSIMGLVKPGSGYIKLFNNKLDEVRKKVCYVPQRESVDWDFPASVFDIVMMGRFGHLGLFNRPGKIDREIVEDCLNKVNMIPYKNRQISQLSGGQQQRVFLARALAQQADLYLMDEPFVGVDASTEKIIVDLLKSMQKEGKTVIVVHHNLQTVEEYFDWVVLLNLRLVASGPTGKVFNPTLVQNAFGGKLTVFSKVMDQVAKEQIEAREKY